MKNVNLETVFGILMPLSLASAQFYGSYGRNVLIRPQAPQFLFPYPYPPVQGQLSSVPLLSRINVETPQQIQQASAQISRGSEMFSFDMFRVSIFRLD